MSDTILEAAASSGAPEPQPEGEAPPPNPLAVLIEEAKRLAPLASPAAAGALADAPHDEAAAAAVREAVPAVAAVSEAPSAVPAETAAEPAPEPWSEPEPAPSLVESPVEAASPAAVPLAPAPIAAAPPPAAPAAAEAPLTLANSPLGRTSGPGLKSKPPLLEKSGAEIDTALAGFDHVVALASYALLFVSVFMFGLPALASAALAFVHKRDAHLLVRTHYVFQLRIFWTAVLFLALCVGSLAAAGGLAIGALVGFVRDHLPGLSGAVQQAHVAAWSPMVVASLTAAAVLFLILSVVWTLAASVFGFVRLLFNRPIGHRLSQAA